MLEKNKPKSASIV